MRLTHSSLIAGMICLGFMVGCDHSMRSDVQSQQNDGSAEQTTTDEQVPAKKPGVSAGEVSGESHVFIMKPGVVNKQDEAKAHAKHTKKK
jgi:hypothetical protein